MIGLSLFLAGAGIHFVMMPGFWGEDSPPMLSARFLAMVAAYWVGAILTFLGILMLIGAP